MLLLSFALALADSRHLLFVGNSYTQAGNLHQVAGALFLEGAPTGDDVSVAVAIPGYTLPQHLADADGTHGDTALREALVTGTDTWDWVMLQDQSQIPGFPEDQQEVLDSLAALPPLDALIAAKGAQTVLLMTWGRRSGDEMNPEWYPDYLTMQEKLAAGYENYAAAITTPERTAWVAPAGYSFRHVYDAAVAAGEDPLDEAGLFWRLYQVDGSHPSPLGTYMVACVVYSTISGNECTGLSAPPDLAPDDVWAVQQAADAAVFAESPELTYPWGGTGGDTGTDTGGDSGGDTDTGPDTASDADTAGSGDSGVIPIDVADDGTTPGGCGCATAPGPSAALGVLAALSLLSLRRRSA